MKIFVCHSTQHRCGVREYGLALDRTLANGEMPLTAFPYSELETHVVQTLMPGDVLLVHFEPGLISHDFVQSLTEARAKRVKTVFVCHWFDVSVLHKYASLVDRFVLHRAYPGIDPDDTRCVVIPLGCPVFQPVDREPVRDRLGLSRSAFIIAVAGFLVDNKRIPECLDALLEHNDDVHALVQTPWPFQPASAPQEENKIVAIRNRHPSRVFFSTEFLDEQELLTRVSACDFGMAFHAANTGSVSATAKQFIAARRPVALSASNHTSDISTGVFRTGTLDPKQFGRMVAEAVRDKTLLQDLRAGVEREYVRLNLGAIANRYRDLFRSL